MVSLRSVGALIAAAGTQIHAPKVRLDPEQCGLEAETTHHERRDRTAPPECGRSISRIFPAIQQCCIGAMLVSFVLGQCTRRLVFWLKMAM